MASLIVRIGAEDAGLSKTLKDIGVQGKSVDEQLSKIGNKPFGAEAERSALKLSESLKAVRDNTSSIASTADNAAAGINRIGGVTALTSRQLDVMARTVRDGLDAYRALGQEAPAELQKVSAAIQKQQAELKALNASSKATAASPVSSGLNGVLGGLLPFTGVEAIGLAAGATLAKLTRDALVYADSLTKISDRTDIDVVALQRLDAIAEPSGNTLEQVANAVNRFQKNLASGAPEAAQALDRIGLSFDALRKQSPDEQFIAIAKGIQKIKDPAEQTLIAMQLFGKGGAEILPTLKANVDELANSTVKMSAESVKAWDDLGDAIGRWKRNSVASIGNVVGAFLHAAQEFDKNHPTGFTPELPPVLPNVPSALSLPNGAPNLSRGVDDALARLNAGLAEEAKNAKDAAESLQRVAAIHDKLFGTTVIRDANEYARALGNVENISNLTAAEQGKLRQTMVDAIATYQAAGRTVPPALQKIVTEIDSLSHAQKALDTAAAGSQGPLIGLNFSLSQLSNLAKGLTSEGLIPLAKGFDDLSRAEQAAAIFSENLARELKRTREALLAALATPTGLPNVGPLNKKLIDDARDGTVATDNWHDSVDELSRAFAHMAQVSDGELGVIVRDIGNIITSFELATKSVKAFNDAETKTGKALALASGGAAVLGATGQGSTVSRVAGGALTGAEVGSVFGPLGTAIGAIAGGLTGLFRGLANNAEKEINPIRESFVLMNGGLDALNKHAHDAGVTLDALLNARNPEQYKKAVDDLNAAFGRMQKVIDDANSELSGLLKSAVDMGGILPGTFDSAIQKLKDMGRITNDNADLFSQLTSATSVNFKTMEDIANKYGIKLADLGPAFQSAKLGDTAKSIINDFDTLVRGGADVDAVLAGLRKPINDIVNDSIKFKVAIPENMRIWVEQLARTGQLIDENGDKITDLSGIKFADPIKTEFQKLIDKISELIAKLTGPLTAAITGLPNANIDVNLNVNTPQDNGPIAVSTGGLVVPGGVQRFARGGRVLPFLSRGTDTVPALLTPGEIVLNAGQQSAIASRLSGSGGVNESGDLHIALTLDGEIVARSVVKNFRRNPGGVGSDARAALGQKVTTWSGAA